MDLSHAFAEAFRVDATGDARDAVRAHLEVVRLAAAADGDAWQVPALEASLDVLAMRSMPSLGEAARDASLAGRTREPIAESLASVAERDARGPFARGLIARALTSLAQRRGDAATAEKWRAASGCAREALVVGPTTWAPVTGVDDPGPFDRADARIEAAYATGDAFGTTLAPVVVRDRGCAIDLSATSSRPGVRDLVVDVRVPRTQTIGLALRAHGAAVLRAGSAIVLKRPFELGDGEAARFARVTVSAGILRVVARVGTAKEDDSVEIDAFGDDGAPLEMHAAAASANARASVLGVHPAGLGPASDDPALIASVAAIASGDPRSAERTLWGAATRPDAPPDLALAYARAIDAARDLSPAQRAERARSAYERVLEAWPASWEAIAAHAVLAGVRRGRAEGGIETLRDLDSMRAKATSAQAPVLDAFDALTSGRERLFDRARAALERARPAIGGTSLFALAEAAASPLAGADLAARECDLARPVAHDTLACFDARRAAGDRDVSKAELTRLRTLFGAPARWLPLELREAIGAGDDATAARAFAAMLPAEQTLAALPASPASSSRAGAPASSSAGAAAPDARDRLLRLASIARDAPAAIAPLLRAAGDDPAREFDGVAERVAAEDRAKPILPSAATAVLAHVERYALSASGLLHWTLFDVRRVSGTTDVEANAQAGAPDVWGRATTRALRRRILKRDGRIVEPDRTPRAAQSHADLSQLEQGDIVEAIYEGWSLPGDTGDVGIDTPDLLPERTAVHDATIELRLPKGLRASLWSHPLLGKADEREEKESTRVLAWHLVDRPVRRVEDGVPKMDRSANVSFSTAKWQNVARALRETIATLDDHDPEIAAWARDAAGRADGKATRATVDAVVAAAGKAIHESDPGQLSDYGGGIAPAQNLTARTFLASHDGSRSWLVVRALRELGVACDVVVSESDPFSADASFPPHFGRFVHPLVVARLPDGDVWIDADVAGPPLPAGRVSPELRGRMTLGTDGSIAPLPALVGADERDEIDVRLALDAHGDARGTFAVVLRGRDAQELAEALFRIVGADRQRALRDVVLAWLPWANVDDVALASSEGSWQVSLRAEVSVSGYAQREAERAWLLPGLDPLHWSWPRARVASLGSTFATRAGRESALAVSTAVQYHVHRRIDLPKGAVVARMPGPLDVKAKLVDASRKISVGAGSIEDDFVLGVTTGTIPAADYDAFVTTAHAADDGFLASTRVTMP